MTKVIPIILSGGAAARLRGELTLISVAHRISTLANCDRVIMLKNGSVHADGPLSKILENKN